MASSVGEIFDLVVLQIVNSLEGYICKLSTLYRRLYLQIVYQSEVGKAVKAKDAWVKSPVHRAKVEAGGMADASKESLDLPSHARCQLMFPHLPGG